MSGTDGCQRTREQEVSLGLLAAGEDDNRQVDQGMVLVHLNPPTLDQVILADLVHPHCVDWKTSRGAQR